MVDDLNVVAHSSLRAAIIGVLGMLSLLSPLPVSAQVLPDPTRPSTYDPSQAYGAWQDGSVLQSIMISPKRRSAIISGVKVDLGGQYADAKLIRISEGEVVLQRGVVLQTLKLFPGVEKRTTGVAKTATRPAKKSGKKTDDK